MTAAVYSTDRSAPLRLFTGHISDVTAVCWHENGTLIATSGDDKTARLWDLRTGKGVRIFTGSPSPLSCVALSSSSSTPPGRGAPSLLLLTLLLFTHPIYCLTSQLHNGFILTLKCQCIDQTVGNTSHS